MEYRYFLTHNNVEVEVDEPIGFDKFAMKLRRSNHGISWSTSLSELTFVRSQRPKYADPYKVITEAYAAEGVDAEVWLRIESRCDQGPWETLAEGVLDFVLKYEASTDPYCSVSSILGQRGSEMSFMSRRKVKVDMDATVAFDGAQLLSGLGQNIELPAKAVGDQGQAELLDHSFTFQTENMNTGYPSYSVGRVPMPFTTTGKISMQNDSTFYNQNQFPPACYVMHLKSTEFVCSIEVDATIKGYVRGNSGGEYTAWAAITSGGLYYKVGSEPEVQLIAGEKLVDDLLGDVRVKGSGTINLSDVALDTPIYIYYRLDYQTGYMIDKYLDHTVTTNLFRLDVKAILFYNGISKAKVYLIHEVLDKVVSAATNNSMPVVSNYYGRTDSLRNATAVDGPGSLRCITNGYNIRRAVLQSGPVQTFVDWDTLFSSLEAIDNIGYAMQDGKVVVEPYEYFYPDRLLFDASRAARELRSFSNDTGMQSITIGYDKWEAETDYGLDGFHGTRQYRTLSNNLNNDRKITSKLIADGYAIEATRGLQFGDNNKDWRYDNNLFLIDLRRMEGLKLVVNLGVEGTDGTLVDETTIYNARLSPARMAMRWRNYITQACVDTDLLFTGAEGYTGALMQSKGNMGDTTDVLECKALAENDDISDGLYREPQHRLFCSETVEFAHPLTVAEFNAIKADPHGLVKFPGGEGWIQELEWDTAKYLGKFTLIVKRAKADPKFRWENTGGAYCQLDRRGNNNGNRMQPQKRQYSNDGGGTWLDVVPPRTREACTLDKVLCPVVPQDMVVRIKADQQPGYIDFNFTTDELVMSDLIIKFKVGFQRSDKYEEVEYTVSFPKNNYKASKTIPTGRLREYRIVSISPSSDETWNYKAE